MDGVPDSTTNSCVPLTQLRQDERMMLGGISASDHGALANTFKAIG
jgi:hypothetical protein